MISQNGTGEEEENHRRVLLIIPHQGIHDSTGDAKPCHLVKVVSAVYLTVKLLFFSSHTALVRSELLIWSHIQREGCKAPHPAGRNLRSPPPQK